MQIMEYYSHLNGWEYLQVHHRTLWDEVCQVITEVDGPGHKTKVSREKRTRGKVLYSPKAMNETFKNGFWVRGWRERRNSFYVTADESLLRGIYGLGEREQKAAIERAGYDPISSYNQTDFIKDRVAVEVQFGKYAFVAHDLFVKHLSFYVSDIIDVGIEILPMKSMEQEMSSGVPYYERDLLNVIRQGRGVPAVPLVLVGIAP
ncbi:MAG: restriction endonuclease [Acidimicrobiia bacterium]|nr:restriction endonuclease [Acidimicrobiia bacterium]MYB43814.1 restriction endonuclease [Acidimicrobiia bacterium]MYF83674.1 restriction endonuclease [Acidimicrobiia bacterium]